MRNLWLKFGCFLTGYNYKILKNCSEVSKKTVIQYTAALIILMIIWGIVGYSFSSNYLDASTEFSVISSLVMIVIVIQIERQIILNTKTNRNSKYARFLLAIIMAFIGALIVDQKLFHDDIQTKQDKYLRIIIDERVEMVEQSVQKQIYKIDSTIKLLSEDLDMLNNQYSKKPTISTYETIREKQKLVTEFGLDSLDEGGLPVMKWVVVGSKSVPIQNPIINEITLKNEDRQNKYTRLEELNNELIQIRKDVQSKAKLGFLTEIEVMWELITSSYLIAFVWFVWFLFFFSIEILVLAISSAKDDDYHATIKHSEKMIKIDLEEYSKDKLSKIIT